jgi:hypothetical protein
MKLNLITVSGVLILLFAAHINSDAQAQSAENIKFKETRLKILDQYLASNPQNCDPERVRPYRVKDNYFDAAVRSEKSEASEIIINDVFCEAGFSGEIDSSVIFLAALTAVNASKLTDAKPIKNLHPALSIVADWEIYPEVLNAWALTELAERNLGIYPSTSLEGVGVVKSQQSFKIELSILDMAKILFLADDREKSKKDDVKK